MIRQIRGKVLAVSPTRAMIEVAGFGIEVRTSATEILTVGSEATLATHLTLKKDGLELYGFTDVADRDFFELILSVSGVGPKTAQGVLSRAPRAAVGEKVRKRSPPAPFLLHNFHF